MNIFEIFHLSAEPTLAFSFSFSLSALTGTEEVHHRDNGDRPQLAPNCGMPIATELSLR